ncbi:FtsX-like permease family protein [Nocardioides sambongensis]|uniref:FtsX-like permease family protein n=1 Tax=Nocardioides sambongensis TaxID=2589074 RepID=UPI001129158D|nr:ABC transporter permease [Nocardioides sambongensis]
MSTTASLARRSVWAHRSGFIGTLLVLGLAALLLAVAGVLAESGLRGAASDGGTLLMLAGSYASIVLVVAVLVVAVTVSLALRGRRREFALYRTIGATPSQLRTQVGSEVLLLAAIATPVGAAAGLYLPHRLGPLLRDAGLLAPHAAVALSPAPVLCSILLVLPVAWWAARLALRQTLRSAPGQAVRASTIESPRVGTARQVAAVVVAGAGFATAFSPLLLPGALGGASAAISAFLLIGAAGLAGPLLVRWSFTRSSVVEGRLGAPGRLAAANLRGFSHRLTAVVIPLALAITTGTAQTTVDRTVTEATAAQLRDGLQADLVVSSPDPAELAAATQLPGVTATTTLTAHRVQVSTDPELERLVGALAWEPTTLQSIAPGPSGLLIDADTRAGSLADLTGTDTVALSRDAALVAGFGIGGEVAIRWPDAPTTHARVVAIYERGLGFGDYLVGPRADGNQDEAQVDTLLIGTTPGAANDVRTAAAGLGLDVTSVTSYAEAASTASGAERTLTTLLLLALLAFVLIAAVNTLVMVTLRRRSELRLYALTGATRRQLVRMVLLESLVTGGLAWLLGTLAVLPAVVGVSTGMLGLGVPPVDLRAYLTLSFLALVLPVLAVVPAALPAVWARFPSAR